VAGPYEHSDKLSISIKSGNSWPAERISASQELCSLYLVVINFPIMWPLPTRVSSRKAERSSIQHVPCTQYPNQPFWLNPFAFPTVFISISNGTLFTVEWTRHAQRQLESLGHSEPTVAAGVAKFWPPLNEPKHHHRPNSRTNTMTVSIFYRLADAILSHCKKQSHHANRVYEYFPGWRAVTFV
jgi:hypothetical protein